MDVTVPSNLECLLLVSNDNTKTPNISSRDSDIKAGEGVSDTDVGEDFVVDEPETPVKVLNVFVLLSAASWVGT